MLAFAGRTKPHEMVRWNGIALPHLVGIGQPDRVKTICYDFLEDEGVVLAQEPAGGISRGFGAVPVHAADNERRTGGIVNLGSAGVPASGAERSGCEH